MDDVQHQSVSLSEQPTRLSGLACVHHAAHPFDLHRGHFTAVCRDTGELPTAGLFVVEINNEGDNRQHRTKPVELLPNLDLR
ncbi:hypothetical protein GPALN_009773 [Globodera pallida]|nr:hypothetical protein GPALN_009773 [Globodera pallida]